jgi:hypothetical protein
MSQGREIEESQRRLAVFSRPRSEDEEDDILDEQTLAVAVVDKQLSEKTFWNTTLGFSYIAIFGVIQTMYQAYIQYVEFEKSAINARTNIKQQSNRLSHTMLLAAQDFIMFFEGEVEKMQVQFSRGLIDTVIKGILEKKPDFLKVGDDNDKWIDESIVDFVNNPAIASEKLEYFSKRFLAISEDIARLTTSNAVGLVANEKNRDTILKFGEWAFEYMTTAQLMISSLIGVVAIMFAIYGTYRAMSLVLHGPSETDVSLMKSHFVRMVGLSRKTSQELHGMSANNSLTPRARIPSPNPKTPSPLKRHERNGTPKSPRRNSTPKSSSKTTIRKHTEDDDEMLDIDVSAMGTKK